MYFLGDCELWSWWCKFLWQSVPGAWSPLFQLRLCVEQAPVAELKGTWACILLKDDFFVWCLSERWKRICDAVWTTVVTAVLWVLLFLTSRCSVRVAWKCPVWTCRSYSGEPPQFHHRWVARSVIDCCTSVGLTRIVSTRFWFGFSWGQFSGSSCCPRWSLTEEIWESGPC